MSITIESFIHRKIVVLKEDTPASQAARAMCDNRIGCVLVANAHGHLTGIATDRDLTCGLLASRSDVDTPLLEIMTTEPVTVDESAQLEDVIQLMEENGIRRIPVVHRLHEGRQRAVGLISVDDLLASQTVDLSQIAKIVQAQIRQTQIRPVGQRGLRKVLAQRRSEAHMEQTLAKFYKYLKEKLQLSETEVPLLVHDVLAMMIRRLHYTGAAHFIAQLPHLLQEELLDLPAGPDRRIDRDAIVEVVQQRLGVNESSARGILSGFSEALGHLIDPCEVEHMKSQLPLEIRELFSLKRAA